MKNIQLNGSALSLVLFALFPAPASAGGQDRVFKCMIAELHPTQLAVGMAEVREKEHKLSKMDAIKLEKYKEANPEPTAKGPGGALYIIDHHHLALALFNIGVRETYCAQAADYSGLETSAFWGRMEDNKWVYAYDEYGGGPRP